MAHLALKLPLDVHNKPNEMCSIKKNSVMAAVLQKARSLSDHNCLSERAILAAKKVDIDQINFQIQEWLQGELMFL